MCVRSVKSTRNPRKAPPSLRIGTVVRPMTAGSPPGRTSSISTRVMGSCCANESVRVAANRGRGTSSPGDRPATVASAGMPRISRPAALTSTTSPRASTAIRPDVRLRVRAAVTRSRSSARVFSSSCSRLSSASCALSWSPRSPSCLASSSMASMGRRIRGT